MKGPRGVAVALEQHLQARIVDEAARLVDELGPVVVAGDEGTEGQDVVVDVEVQLIASAPIPPTDVGIDDWPFVIIAVRSMSSQTMVDRNDDGSEVWERSYPVRLFGFARGDGYHSTVAARDRLVLLLSELLMRWPTFGSGGEARISANDLTEEYSDVGSVGDDLAATVAAGYVTTTVVVAETLTPALPPLVEEIEGVEISADHLPVVPDGEWPPPDDGG